jgi:hypothetical protein
VFQAFCSPEIHAISATWTSTVYVVACTCGKPGGFDQVSWATVNHFVHAYPLNETVEGVVDLNLADDEHKAKFEDHLNACLAADSVTNADATLISSYLDWGWALQLTVEDGDCGINVMAIHKALPLTAGSFRAERLSVSSAQRGLAGEEWYKDAFECCQEWSKLDDATDAELEKLFLDETDADATSSEPPAASEHEPADSDSESSVQEQPNAEEEPVGPSDAVVLCWAMKKTKKGTELLEDHGEPEDCDVQNIIALEELIQLRKEYLCEKAQSLGPKKRVFTTRSRTLLKDRLDLGKEYLEWLELQTPDVQKRGLATHLGFPSAGLGGGSFAGVGGHGVHGALWGPWSPMRPMGPKGLRQYPTLPVLA